MQQAGVTEGQAAAPAAAVPRSVPALLPYVWSQLLFPGAAPAAGPWRWDALLLLLVLPAVLLYPCTSFYLFEPDEGRYAEIPREMLARGEWVVPYLHGEPYLDKPPLLYWLVMVSYQVLGVHDWAARLVPALAVHGCILLTYLLGRRSLGERAAFWGALALALAPGFTSMGRLLILDGVLAALVLLALCCAFEAVRTGTLSRRWWAGAALACGLGVLAKGPVALVLLVPPLWLHRRLGGRAARVGWRDGAVFAALVLAVALPWYVAVCLRTPDFARHFLWEHNVVRFLTPFDHLRPVWFYGPVLLLGLFPAVLLLVPFGRFLLATDTDVCRRRSPECGFMLLAGGWCVFFFSMSGCKLPTYILPAFPPLCLALGAFVAASPWARSRWTRVVAGVGFVTLLAGHYIAVPWYAHYHSPMNRPGEVAACCGDRATSVVCYPRSVDSVAFYLGRDDFRSYRSKETPSLVEFLRARPRVAVLCSHRHSLEQLVQTLPPELGVVRTAPLGPCAMAVVERRHAPKRVGSVSDGQIHR
jgi:4-amino-4-deoxy-L-arabinose transferase-like glycosyltransferase